MLSTRARFLNTQERRLLELGQEVEAELGRLKLTWPKALAKLKGKSQESEETAPDGRKSAGK